MSLLQSVLMGLIQGLTEFLPVSSSGHLALFKILFHVNTDTGILFDVLLHVGTLLAVVVVYFRDIVRLIMEAFGMVLDGIYNLTIWIGRLRHQEGNYRKIVHNGYRKMVLLMIVSTIPTAIIGYAGQDLVSEVSETLIVPGVCLIITAVLLFISDRAPDGWKRPRQTGYDDAFIIGICQGFAVLPGISRSGTTITACVLNGFDRRYAVKYSFILSLPAILGALVLELKDLGQVQVSASEAGCYVAGMAVAAVVGYICIKTMLLVVKNKKFKYFSIYCLVAGALAIGGYFFM